MDLFASFAFFLLLFIAVGVWSRKKASDYYDAGKDVSPWFIGLSMAATGNSSWMLLGLVSFTFRSGIMAFSLMIGWMLGDYLIWRKFYGKVWLTATEKNFKTYFELFKEDIRYNKLFIGAAAIMAMILLSMYAAAQFHACGKSFGYIFDTYKWNFNKPELMGIILASLIVGLYCSLGGLKASIYTDLIQAAIMFIAVVVLLCSCFAKVGSPIVLWEKLSVIDPNLIQPKNITPGKIFLELFAWFMAGMATAGQPHIVIRLFSIKSKTENIKSSLATARRVYFVSWGIYFVLSILVALYARVLLVEKGFDPELALFRLSSKILDPFWVGVVLAGLFSAAISTADSLVLSSSAAMSKDFLGLFEKKAENEEETKNIFGTFIKFLSIPQVGTCIIVFLAVGICFVIKPNIFATILDAWGYMGVAFTPIFILLMMKRSMSTWTMIAMAISGVVVAILWQYPKDNSLGKYITLWLFDEKVGIYMVLPGMIAGFMTYLAACLVAKIKHALKL